MCRCFVIISASLLLHPAGITLESVFKYLCCCFVTISASLYLHLAVENNGWIRVRVPLLKCVLASPFLHLAARCGEGHCESRAYSCLFLIKSLRCKSADCESRARRGCICCQCVVRCSGQCPAPQSSLRDKHHRARSQIKLHRTRHTTTVPDSRGREDTKSRPVPHSAGFECTKTHPHRRQDIDLPAGRVCHKGSI